MHCVCSLTFVLTPAVRITWLLLLADMKSSLQMKQWGDLERLIGTKADKKIVDFLEEVSGTGGQKAEGL